MDDPSELVKNEAESSKMSSSPADPKEPSYPTIQLLKSNSWLLKNKLSPEFTNVRDEAALGTMIGDDGEKLLALVDDIRQIDKLRDVELNMPQIVVVGDTSSGKSSVLQALTRLPFPVASDLCTRFVTKTTIRRCAAFERPGYKIEVESGSPGLSQDLPFPPKSFDSDDWSQVYQKLKHDIAEAFDMMSPANLPSPMAQRHSRPGFRVGGARSTPQLLRHTLEINVRKPDQAHFSIVDVPGFVSTGADADVQLSLELARRFVQKTEAIVLAITPANYVIENQKWFNLVRAESALDRTIGVITKCDLIENTNEGKLLDRLRNKVENEHHLKLGWFAVRNRSPEEVLDEESFDERDRKEKDLFVTGKFKKALSDLETSEPVDPDVFGIQCLKRKVQEHLYRKVKENVPTLGKMIKALEIEYDEKLRKLGDPRENPRDQRVFLSDIQMLYEAEVERSLNGDYRDADDSSPSRLRCRVKTFNDEFELEMQHTGIKYRWQLNDEDDGDDQTRGILHWIHQTWISHRGSEPRHDPPRSLKNELVKQQTESWGQDTEKYIERVEDAIRKCNDFLFELVCPEANLRTKIRARLRERETNAFAAAKAELRNLLKERTFLDSWNPLLGQFIANHQHPRLERQEVKHRLLQRRIDASQQGGSETPSPEVVAAREEFYNINKKVYEVHDWLYAYWKVTYPRFVDNVIIQVVERHLLGPNGPLRLFDRNWIMRLEDHELLELAGEDEKTRDERENLKQKLEGLKDALQRTEEALRSRNPS